MAIYNNSTIQHIYIAYSWIEDSVSVYELFKLSRRSSNVYNFETKSWSIDKNIEIEQFR